MQSKRAADLAMLMTRYTLEEIQALADSGDLEKLLPALGPPPDSSAPSSSEVELLDHRNFDQVAYARYLWVLEGAGRK
jgi:hypothetical protein